ncbi:tubulin folding cofactor C, putative [Acanthamoeba castellanii str. Neff]|uniref:Tubulin folding cofactor C, putative n=1 Tax=Acanthamoeba castellanii (strain ATCC 30010 / Neff) TaxID=1257118 RepID=L8HK69_ACACF|nr:tubulin folding cofactor C, putative [Acanthamoeba castellanii str. Neff]ELR25068.1 tubulin folding cofactor C, putative [Acanthamoeba castellanii str. Neff]
MADFSLSNLTDCTVYICAPLRAIRMYNLKSCSVFVGPVAGSALLYDCQGCSFSIASQQLRVHNTTDSDFYLLARSKPIIENCDRVRFAPYNFSYAQLEEQLEESLDVPTNFWNSVEDFNWPRIGEVSPYWSILPEEERRATVTPPSRPSPAV